MEGAEAAGWGLGAWQWKVLGYLSRRLKLWSLAMLMLTRDQTDGKECMQLCQMMKHFLSYTVIHIAFSELEGMLL